MSEEKEGAPEEVAQAESEERYLRLRADFENFRRRNRQEMEELGEVVRGGVLTRLLPIMDNLERAAAAALQSDNLEALQAGLSMTLKQFQEFLEREGVGIIATQGQPFNPEEHEALLQEDSEEDEGTVLAELTRGYRLGRRVLRPAMVKVARRASQ